jgi:hypothetical protein
LVRFFCRRRNTEKPSPSAKPLSAILQDQNRNIKLKAINIKIKSGLFILLSIALISCNKGKFKTNDSDFQHIFNDLVKSGHKADVTWDAEVHSYTFILNENKSIKSFGYQSHSSLSSTEYLIEIINNTDSSIVYSGGHLFSSNDISYVTPNSQLNLQSGVHYTLNRIQTNWGQYITETIGHLVKTEQSDYPLSFGSLTITETSFHDDGSSSSWQKFRALPRVDLVFN